MSLMLDKSDFKDFAKIALAILLAPAAFPIIIIYIPIILTIYLVYLFVKPLDYKKLDKWIVTATFIFSCIYYTLLLYDYKIHNLYVALIKYLYYYLWVNIIM